MTANATRLTHAGCILAALAGGLLWQERLGDGVAERPLRPAEEFRIVPVRVHLLRAQELPAVHTSLSTADIERIFRKANMIWHEAGVHLWVESVREERPAMVEDPHVEVLDPRQLLPLRPEAGRSGSMLHVYYVGKMSVNGIYLRQSGIFVQQAAKLVEVDGGIDEPLPRVTSHEIGHGLGLAHRQDRTNLMASGTTGTSLNEAEIATAREIAAELSWMPLAPAFLDVADRLVKQKRLKEARSRYETILALPGASPLKARARKGLAQSIDKADRLAVE